MEITEREKGIIAMCRYNLENLPIEIRKRWVIKKLEITFYWCSKKKLWGRFGGGWNWELGFRASGKTIILNILIFSLRFYWNNKKAEVK